MTHPVLRTDEAPYQCSRAQCQYINFAVVILREVFDIYAVLFCFLFFLSPFFGVLLCCCLLLLGVLTDQVCSDRFDQIFLTQP